MRPVLRAGTSSRREVDPKARARPDVLLAPFHAIRTDVDSGRLDGSRLPRNGCRVKPRLLDAFCCAGGATRGYQRAGLHVTGVDIEPQPHYCGDDFVRGDAVAF